VEDGGIGRGGGGHPLGSKNPPSNELPGFDTDRQWKRQKGEERPGEDDYANTVERV